MAKEADCKGVRVGAFGHVSICCCILGLIIGNLQQASKWIRLECGCSKWGVIGDVKRPNINAVNGGLRSLRRKGVCWKRETMAQSTCGTSITDDNSYGQLERCSYD